MYNGLGGLLQRFPPYDKIWDQIEQKVLPGAPVRVFLDYDRRGKKYRSGDYLYKGFTNAFFVMFVIMFVMFVCHSISILLWQS